jgi:hypothetical protein
MRRLKKSENVTPRAWNKAGFFRAAGCRPLRQARMPDAAFAPHSAEI